MAIQSSEVFVLKRAPLRESSLLVTLLSRAGEKLRGEVKGIRSEKHPRLGLFEPFTHLSVVYYEKVKSDVHLIAEAHIVSANAELRDTVERFSYASYLAELIDVLSVPHDPHAGIFELLSETFETVKAACKPAALRAFEVKLFAHLGWLPILTQCAVCGNNSTPLLHFSPKQGGLICKGCAIREPRTVHISSGGVSRLKDLLRFSIADGARLAMTRQVECELERVWDLFLQFRLDYPLRAKRFLADLKTHAAPPAAEAL